MSPGIPPFVYNLKTFSHTNQLTFSVAAASRLMHLVEQISSLIPRCVEFNEFLKTKQITVYIRFVFPNFCQTFHTSCCSKLSFFSPVHTPTNFQRFGSCLTYVKLVMLHKYFSRMKMNDYHYYYHYKFIFLV